MKDLEGVRRRRGEERDDPILGVRAVPETWTDVEDETLDLLEMGDGVRVEHVVNPGRAGFDSSQLGEVRDAGEIRVLSDTLKVPETQWCPFSVLKTCGDGEEGKNDTGDADNLRVKAAEANGRESG